MPQVTRLIQLIEENCRQKGYSENKIRKIVALIKTTLDQGVPDHEDLKDRLEAIGELE